MLYNKNWDYKVKADPFSLESLIAWLEKKPPETSYDYCEIGDCLVARYLKAMGVKRFELSPCELALLGWKYIVQNYGAKSEDEWTFGAALERARAALTSCFQKD